MAANRGREIPDATPPFLTKDGIDGWIAAAEARQQGAMNALKLEVQDQFHEFDKGQLHLIRKVEKLAGDGEQDVGAVGRLEKLVTDYITENRQASSTASAERQQLKTSMETMGTRIGALEDAETRAVRVEDQVNRWNLMAIFTRNLWKIIAAAATLALALSGLWRELHPQTVTLSPQQIQELRKSP